MRKLLVLADDFTGGLDTGAQFAAAGIPTVVTTNPAYCAADHEEDTVLVVDVETRHLLPEKARQIVEQTIRAAIAHGFTDIYKKTDSALRGNLGAELQGVLDGTGQTRLHLIPAFPEWDGRRKMACSSSTACRLRRASLEKIRLNRSAIPKFGRF